MRFTLQKLRESKCPNIWHDILRAGKQIGSSVDVPDTEAQRILAACNEPLATVPKKALIQPLPFDQWPLAFQKLASLAQPGDIGLGDIVERQIRALGGDYFKKLWKRATGKDCGCDQRKQYLNDRYPLPASSLK